MNRLQHFAFVLIFFFAIGTISGQISGNKNIPGDYPTIASAISAINASGIGSGGVTFNIAPGYTEIFQNLSDGLITATGTQANPVIFQKSGVGNNPLVTAASPGVGNYDFIFCLVGSDYITFDGIDVQENPLNLDNTQKMEYGFALMKMNETDGAQHNTIKNVTLTLTSNTNAYGINVVNWRYSAPGIPLTITDVAGTNSWNKFYNLNFVNCYSGINLTGYADAVEPYSFYDQGIEVGKDGSNTFTGLGIGGSNVNTYGINAKAQNNLILANNLFTGTVTLTTGRIYAMNLLDATNANLDVYGNTVSINMAGTGMFYGIYINNMGGNGSDNTINLLNNTFINNSFPNHTTGNIVYLYAVSGAVTLNCQNNTLSNNTTGSELTASDGITYYIYLQMNPLVPLTGIMNVDHNTITNNHKSSNNTNANKQNYFLFATGQTRFLNINDNLISNNTSWSPRGNVYGIYSAHIGTTKNIYNNTISNMELNAGNFAGILNGNGENIYIFNNKIQNLTTRNIFLGWGKIAGIDAQFGTGNKYAYCYNNFISELYVPDGTREWNVIGIKMNRGLYTGIYNNTIYLDGTSTASGFGTAGIWMTYQADNVDLRNNLIINESVPTGTGRAIILVNELDTLGVYAATSNNNNYYAGIPDTNRLIYYSPAYQFDQLEDFQAFVYPRESNSISENTNFVNVNETPYDLHIDLDSNTLCESGGVVIADSVSITTDFDGQPRFPNTGYPNNPNCMATAPDIGADEFALNVCPASAEANILSFAFNTAENPSLLNDVIGQIDPVTHSITLEVLENVNVTSLIATFTLSDLATASIGGVVQESGVTANDFTNPVVYTVTAEAGNMQDWTVTVNLTECEQPWDYIITGKVHSISIPLGVAPGIFGTPLEAHDWIGVFYLNNEGEESCGGAVQWNGKNTVVVNAYGDDPTTPEKDGFASGEAFRWRLQQCGNPVDFTAIATYHPDMPNQGNFTDFGLSRLTSLKAAYLEDYSFTQGWNSISSQLTPFEPAVVNMFSGIVNELTILRNLSTLYWPEEGLNTIGDWDNFSGYVLKVTEDIDFQIAGAEYVSGEINLPAGWSYLPVLSQCEANVMEMFGDHLNDVVIIQELIGTGVFWPLYNINTIQNFEPGKAYAIKLNNELTVSFPQCARKTKSSKNTTINSLESPWGKLNMTPSTQVTLLQPESTGAFSEGDVIGVFDQKGRVCGSISIVGRSDNRVITLYGDDITTPEKDGLIGGEAVSYRLFEASTGKTYALEAEYSNELENTSGRFEVGSLSAIIGFKAGTNNLEDTKSLTPSIFPNPTNGALNITGITGLTTVRICDVFGQEIYFAELTTSTTLDVTQLPKGIYLVKISDELGENQRKLIKE